MTKSSTRRRRPEWSVLPASKDRVPLLWQALALLGFVVVIAAVLGEAAKNSDRTSAIHQLVDINFASESELDVLPGIGPSLAREIIKARPYSVVDELYRVKGISKKMAARLLPLVKAGRGRRAADR